MKALVILALAAGCTSYTHRSMHNAPGVVNLDRPPTREVGDPKAYESPESPGTETIVVVALPSVMIGTGRLDTGDAAGELDLAFRVERTVDDGSALLHKSAFGITAGVGLAQFGENQPTIFGGVYAELCYRSIFEVIPYDIGIGPALYPGVTVPSRMESHATELGGQVSLRFPLLAVRARFMTDTGFEIMAGYQVPIPFFFGRSR